MSGNRPGRQAFSPVHKSVLWTEWCAGHERAARASAHAVRQSLEPPVDPRDGRGDYGLRGAHQMGIEPLNETRQGRLQRVKAQLNPALTSSATGYRTVNWPPANAFDPGGWPPAEPGAGGSWHLNDGFHTTSGRPQEAAIPMTRSHRSSLATSGVFRRCGQGRSNASAARARTSGGSRSLSPRRGRALSPTGLCRNTSLIDPRRQERVMRLYHEAHRRRRDDPQGLNVPVGQHTGLEYYDAASSINMPTGKRRGNTLKLLQL